MKPTQTLPSLIESLKRAEAMANKSTGVDIIPHGNGAIYKPRKSAWLEIAVALRAAIKRKAK